MASAIGEKVAYRKSSNLLRTWSDREGKVCDIEGVALSMARPAPRLAHGAEKQEKEVAARPSKPAKAVQGKSDDPYVNLLSAAIDAAEAVGKFSRWLKAPPPPAFPKQSPSSAPVRPAMKVPPFDLQDIPGAMRKLGMPMAAKLQERWLAGKANYSRSVEDLRDQIDQHGQSYAPSMIDSTTIKMDWVLSFARAKRAFDTLIRDSLHAANAQPVLRKKLMPYRNLKNLLAWELANQNLLEFHQKFQFQFLAVNSTWSDRIAQFLDLAFSRGGVPDDLTGALGSFNFYAAVRHAWFDDAGRIAVIPEVSIYVRDPYEFSTNQYLGHWNSRHVAIVPAYLAAHGRRWLDYPVVDRGDVVYPVTNKSYRDWRQRHDQGGDFIIYTDRINIRLDPPLRVAM
jgi:hypothetical protein